MKDYIEGYKLKEHEYLLKIRKKDGRWKTDDTGFLTKFNKDGSFPVNFKNWPGYQYDNNNQRKTDLPIYIIEENFRSGWKLFSWRFGKSRNWAVLLHPAGFTLEIHMEEFLSLTKKITIINGELQGKFKWQKNILVNE